MNNVVYLDADFVIKTSKVKKDSSTLFDEIIKLPYTFRITNIVLNEIRNSNVQQNLLRLVMDGKLKVVKSTDCINDLKRIFSPSAIENLVLSTLKDICINVCGDEILYKSNFYKLEALAVMGDDINHFSRELEYAIASVPSDNNIGEIVTLLSIALTNRIENVNVISLLSHDSAARSCILTLHENINSYDCYTCFYLLKQNSIITYADAKQFVSSWLKTFPKNNIVKIMDGKQKKGIEMRLFIDIVFNQSGYTILRNGMLKK